MRSGRQQFTYSKVMAWVAFDRAVKYAERCGGDGNVDRWRKLRQTVHQEVCEKGFDPELNSFTQTFASKRLDASLLLIPLVGFLPPDDKRVRGTVEAIEKHLMSGGFVHRYDPSQLDDGVRGEEGRFLACSFWLVSALHLMGQRDKARTMFERLLSLRNDVGLLSEEYDPEAGRLVGNFPQALSHIALVNSAFEVSRVSGPGKQRAESTPAPAPQRRVERSLSSAVRTNSTLPDLTLRKAASSTS